MDKLIQIPINELEKAGNFQIQEAPNNLNLSEMTKLSLTEDERMQLSNLIQSMPVVIGTAASSKLYTVKFPKGVPHTLTKFKKGGYSTMIHDQETGDLLAHASFHKAIANPGLVSAFAIMSIATSQYYLNEINNKLEIITHKIDRILDFLYGEKKAELLAEISFTKYAYENFSTIMQFDEQRAATIDNLQESRKVAMKDIEFYLSDLNSLVNSETKNSELAEVHNRALQISDSIDLSIQLYAASGLLEVLYSQNIENSYVSYLEKEISYYVEKCDKRVLADFTTLKAKVDNYKKPAVGAGLDKAKLEEKINLRLDSIFNGEAAKRQKALMEVLHSVNKPMIYAINSNGEVYYKEIA